MELTFPLLGTGLHEAAVNRQRGKTRVNGVSNTPEAVSNIILSKMKILSPELLRKVLCNWVAIQAGSQESVLIQVRITPHIVLESQSFPLNSETPLYAFHQQRNSTTCSPQKNPTPFSVVSCGAGRLHSDDRGGGFRHIRCLFNPSTLGSGN